MKTQNIYTQSALLLFVAGLSALMWLSPVSKKEQERTLFNRLWWEDFCDSVSVNRLDSATLYSFPISETTKKAWLYRLNNGWSIISMEGLQKIPGMDTLWLKFGQFNFDPPVTSKTPAKTKNTIQRSYSEVPNYKPSNSNRYSEPKVQLKSVDINEVDSIALESIPGIGPWTARAIIREREKWGYIADPSQLHSIYGLRDRWDAAWDTLLTVNVREKTLSLNTSTFEDLVAFRGLNHRQVRRIVFYREHFEPIRWSVMAEWEEFQGSDLDFLKLYVTE
ncbi:MAG: hypothetical protein RL754_963 [Bacteroidota bacterium]